MRKLKLRVKTCTACELLTLAWGSCLSGCLVPCTGFLIPRRRSSSALWEAWPVFLPEHSSAVQSLSHVQLFVTAAHQASLSITNSQSLLRLTSIQSVMPSNQLILCHSLLLLPSVFPSIRLFSKESVLHIRWPKYWSFRFSISPSNEYSGLVSFRINWLDSLLSKGLSRVFSNTTIQKYQFFGVLLSLWSNSHIQT